MKMFRNNWSKRVGIFQTVIDDSRQRNFGQPILDYLILRGKPSNPNKTKTMAALRLFMIITCHAYHTSPDNSIIHSALKRIRYSHDKMTTLLTADYTAALTTEHIAALSDGKLKKAALHAEVYKHIPPKIKAQLPKPAAAAHISPSKIAFPTA